MDSLNFFGRKTGMESGWKQSAKVNCVILLCLSSALVGCLIAALVESPSEVLFFYHGDCADRKVSAVNLALHLLINMVSTLVMAVSRVPGGPRRQHLTIRGRRTVPTNLEFQLTPALSRLASSNFFMQVLNSPSREEVDAAHRKGTWLGIGVPSVRNAFRVSRFKTWSWIILLLSSIPIHLLFNSAIFETSHRGSDFHMTIATEDFTRGGDYYLPGGSLLPPDLVDDTAYRQWEALSHHNFSSNHTNPDYTFDSSSLAYVNHWVAPHSQYGYGIRTNTSDYSPETPYARNVSATAAAAARWHRLDRWECAKLYTQCSGLTKYRDVLLVANRSAGWVRDDVWHLQDREKAYWDQYVPAQEENHLFYSTQCIMYALLNAEAVECTNTCLNALSLPPKGSPFPYSFLGLGSGTLDMINSSAPDLGTLVRRYGWNSHTSGLQSEDFGFDVSYCLAEPVDDTCSIGLSPHLLLGVTICVLVKSVAALVVTVVLLRQRQDPMVTLGDAVASFVERPDRTTEGLCTVGQMEMYRAMTSSHSLLLPGPRQWLPHQQRRLSVIPFSVWATSYLLFAAGVVVEIYFFHNTTRGGRRLYGEFLQSENNGFIALPVKLISAVLIANSPQLLLSFCYLAYNNLFTRLQMAREWAQFSEGYHPLRVTDPKGEQYATYRLQLPYKYSLPLIVLSMFLHWLLSNTIYVLVSTGGYYGTVSFVGNKPDSTLPDNTAVALGFSTTSMLTLMIVSLLCVLVPPFLSWKKLPLDIVSPGGNSLAISAACHSSPLSYAVRASKNSRSSSDSPNPSPASPASPCMPVRQDEATKASTSTMLSNAENQGAGAADALEMRQLSVDRRSLLSKMSERSVSSRDDEQGEDVEQGGDLAQEKEEQSLRNIAQSRIRWGVIQMPPEWYSNWDADEPVGHLGFGVPEDDVEKPVPGRMYA
ncbi:hypothetical protein F4780DRAFT_797808 [Xylariomycetidae sp. FL0641]|nr:hypothetical protein F4780DRAFT_797808 [Xylariomycetidae sp. FL0641]